MVYYTINFNPLSLKTASAQIFEKRIDNHRTEVKNKEACANPEKRLPGQLTVDVLRKDRFIKEETAEEYNKE
ncbi:hypothetical protein SAMN04488132_10316 [Sediminibacterium ginsengisoli]|uniref:Uncharacterized protein n=1 Tax=Sediminibacterium ginsengisoli TaxID=413434 RepID=A0A1T4LV10_9BACT|nr:hypothetical protein SAMN04488132_10316 [Sediminibacterium ginsengisoli]